jgi:NAD(P)H-dependent FMN reductase
LANATVVDDLICAAADLTPDYMHLEILDLEGIPPFNQDTEQNMPDKVKEFKTKIREADGILIATPEYNFSVPGVLKNAKVTLGFLVFDNIIMAINALMQYVRRIRR